MKISLLLTRIWLELRHNSQKCEVNAILAWHYMNASIAFRILSDLSNASLSIIAIRRKEKEKRGGNFKNDSLFQLKASIFTR